MREMGKKLTNDKEENRKVCKVKREEHDRVDKERTKE